MIFYTSLNVNYFFGPGELDLKFCRMFQNQYTDIAVVFIYACESNCKRTAEHVVYHIKQPPLLFFSVCEDLQWSSPAYWVQG